MAKDEKKTSQTDVNQEETKSTNTEDSKVEKEETIEEAVKKVEEDKKEKKNKYKEQIAKLEADKAKLEAEKAELKNEYLKVFAEMENTKKRLKEEAIKDRKYASQHVIGELLNPIDMLVKIVNMPTDDPNVKNYQIGFQMIANQLVDVLKGEGLAEIQALGNQFDPKYMHAVQTENVEDKEDNVVLSVMQTGYMYKDRVLRPAMVTVNKKEVKKEEE